MLMDWWGYCWMILAEKRGLLTPENRAAARAHRGKISHGTERDWRDRRTVILSVIASHRVGAKRRPMTGSAKQSTKLQGKHGLLPPTRKSASADSKRAIARTASDGGSSLTLLAMTTGG
jgi:hypothetical protein